MKNFRGLITKIKNLAAILLFFSLLIFGNAARVLAHGGEDHGDEKPKVATTDKGTVSRSARLGDFELTLKHPVLEPDTATTARLFITKFETNDPADGLVPTMEIESSGGGVTPIVVEKSDKPGSYNLKIPALGEGKYIARISLKTDQGNNTATLSGIEVEHPATETSSGSSWLSAIMFSLAGVIILGLFGTLFYFIWRMAGDKQVGEETASA